MKWNQYQILTPKEMEEQVGNLLITAGIHGYQVEDPADEKDKISLVFYLPEKEEGVSSSLVNNGKEILSDQFEEDPQKQLEMIEAGLQDLEITGERLFIQKETTMNEDWADNWKQYFKPFSAGQIRIIPAWEEDQSDLPIQISIDPGQVFGSGTHETTRLCLEELQRCVKGHEQVLDLGCGSGILAIAAIRLGADSCVAVDIDQEAVRNAMENAQRNGLKENQFKAVSGNVLENTFLHGSIARQGYDLITANILAEVLEGMIPLFSSYLKEGGSFVLSGILDERKDKILDIIHKQPDLVTCETYRFGDWVCIYGKK